MKVYTISMVNEETECDEIVFITTSLVKAEDFYDTYGVSQFLQFGEYEMDQNYFEEQ